jgi:hypothetical protein
MNRFVLPLFFALITAAPLLAQTEKGNGILSGSLSLAGTRYTDSQQNSRNVSPAFNITFGKFVKDNWLLGTNIGMSFLFRKVTPSVLNSAYGSTLTDRSNRLALKSFVRYYQTLGPVQVFAGAGVSLNLDGSRTEYMSSAQLSTGQNANLTLSPFFEAGANYFLTKRLAAQVVASNGFPLNVGVLSVGLVYWAGAGSTATQPTSTANPQTDAGRWLVEGSVDVSSGISSRKVIATKTVNTDAKADRTVFSFSPSVGYFVKKNTQVGVAFITSFTSSKQTELNKAATSSRSRVFGISPYWQHYLTNNRLTPFIRADVFFYRVGYGYNDEPISYVSSTVGASGRLGLAYMLRKSFIIETTLVSGSLSHDQNTIQADMPVTWSGNLSGQLGSGLSLRYVF